MNSRKLIYLVISFLTFIIITVATIGNGWTAMKTLIPQPGITPKKLNIEEGLWKVCINSDYHTTMRGCHTVEEAAKRLSKDVPGWFHTCRGFSILACVATALGTLLLLVSFKYEFTHLKFSLSFAFVTAFVSLTISIIVYTVQFEKVTAEFASGQPLIPNDTDYGWSYVSAWIGLILSAVQAILAFFVEKKNPYRI